MTCLLFCTKNTVFMMEPRDGEVSEDTFRWKDQNLVAKIS